MAEVFTTETFDSEVLKSDVPVLVDFYADWCGPCKMLAPLVDELAKEFDGRAKVGKVNVDDSETVAAKYGIMSVPTIIIFKDGEEVDKLVGAYPKEKLAEALQKTL